MADDNVFDNEKRFLSLLLASLRILDARSAMLIHRYGSRWSGAEVESERGFVSDGGERG
jgi:hypothetical protein